MVGKKSQAKTIEEFEKNYVKKGMFATSSMRILDNIIDTKAKFKKGKLDVHKMENARKNATILINDLIEYNQRCEIAEKNSKKK